MSVVPMHVCVFLAIWMVWPQTHLSCLRDCADLSGVTSDSSLMSHQSCFATSTDNDTMHCSVVTLCTI